MPSTLWTEGKPPPNSPAFFAVPRAHVKQFGFLHEWVAESTSSESLVSDLQRRGIYYGGQVVSSDYTYMCLPPSDGSGCSGAYFYEMADAPTVDFLCMAMSSFGQSKAALSVFLVGVASTSGSFEFSVDTPYPPKQGGDLPLSQGNLFSVSTTAMSMLNFYSRGSASCSAPCFFTWATAFSSADFIGGSQYSMRAIGYAFAFPILPTTCGTPSAGYSSDNMHAPSTCQ